MAERCRRRASQAEDDRQDAHRKVETGERALGQPRFRRSLSSQCRSLAAPHVNLDFEKGQEGAPARRKRSIPGTCFTGEPLRRRAEGDRVGGLLGRGEAPDRQLSCRLRQSGYQLDYERIREVASRLASLASERQVVVFTHNIWFAVELLERFRDRKADCSYYDIRTLDGRRGIVSGGTPLEAILGAI